MSYDISFKVKVEGADLYVPVGNCEANITWNVREIITASTGLEWHNEANNGYCTEVIPKIGQGIHELQTKRKKYIPLEPENGWGSVDGVIRFFSQILRDWEDFGRWQDPELINLATFWVE